MNGSIPTLIRWTTLALVATACRRDPPSSTPDVGIPSEPDPPAVEDSGTIPPVTITTTQWLGTDGHSGVYPGLLGDRNHQHERWRLDGWVHQTLPCYDDSGIYVAFDGRVRHLTVDDGAATWTVELATLLGDGAEPTSLAVAEGVVVVAAAIERDRASLVYVVGLRADDGTEIWRDRQDGGDPLPLYWLARLAVSGGNVVLGLQDRIVQYDLASGVPRWSRIGAELHPDFARSEVPAASEELVYVPVVTSTGGEVQAREATTGDLVWATPVTDSMKYVAVGSGLVVLANADFPQDLRVIDAADGTLLWTHRLVGSGFSANGSSNAVITSDRILVTDESSLIALDFAGEVLYSHPTDWLYRSLLTSADGVLFWGGLLIDIASGDTIRDLDPMAYHTVPIGSVLLVGNEDGWVAYGE